MATAAETVRVKVETRIVVMEAKERERERGDVGEDEADKSEDKEFGRYYCETGRSMTVAYLCSR